MPTPSTRTPVRIARGSYSNLNSSISDLQDGEISYAEDQDKLYIKEGGSLVALTYTPASPAFTGTITGVNLTLSGNLTVNGTTTTIDTTTLQVEDKNIEIGKVSNPSDTTADGGGLTLKGATDKTFNWVNATDSWTSSEHIALGDSKQLKLGDSGEFIIEHHSNTNTHMKHTGAGHIYMQSVNDIYLRNNTSQENYARFINNGAVELYHNNVKTFETVANGIKILGPEGGDGEIMLFADEGDDNADKWRIKSDTSGNFKIGNNSTGSWVYGLTLNGSNNATIAGTVSDSLGNLRSIPYSGNSGAYNLAASDAGKVVGGDTSWTIPTGTFSAGDTVTLLNLGGSDLGITATALTYLWNTADAANIKASTITLGGRGMATIYFKSASEAFIQASKLNVS